jgi:FKBP-type peptidyl-prolyl cis-trans isomerase FkpA
VEYGLNPSRRKEGRMRKIVVVSLLTILTVVSVASAAGPDPATEEQKTLYALGLALSRTVATFGLSEAELGFVESGLADGVLHHQAKVDLQTYGPKLQELQRTRMAAVAETEKKASQSFLDKAAAEQNATKTSTGLIITTLTPGSGASPKATDTVKVNYHGTLVYGTVFDSSVQRGQPATFVLNQVIPCWTEGLQQMKVGGKSRLVCPAALAYGDQGRPPAIKPGAALVFEVELLEIMSKQ